jgi:DNA-directed RNA polymerase specialized sigma subunit
MSEDAELLRQYAQSGSETAFTELVGRHLPLVYATALRRGARRFRTIYAESFC